MKGTTLIEGGLIVNEGKLQARSLLIEGDVIAAILPPDTRPQAEPDVVIDATGCYILPGIIDTHVHFRQPSNDRLKAADIHHESRAAAAGGVTSYIDMPNTAPRTTTNALLEDKIRMAEADSMVNYSFYIGAERGNTDELIAADPTIVPAIKLFMGSSTGNMLVDDEDALRDIFARTKLPIMAHCEDNKVIVENAEMARKWGSAWFYKQHQCSSPNIAWPDIRLHPLIRSAEACWRSSSLAAELAREYDHRLHIAHISTAQELSLPDGSLITAEAAIGHLIFSDQDYWRYGARIKVNPAIKTADDRDALRKALTNGRIYTVATDHAPHTLRAKQGGIEKAASGMPMVQFSLPAMLSLVDSGTLSIERLVRLMCHNPADLYGIDRRGYLRPRYKADIAIVRPHSPWKLRKPDILSFCRWSPMLGKQFDWKVERTICNGKTVWNGTSIVEPQAGELVRFRRI